MSTNPSWISRLVSLVKPHIGVIVFAFSILSASVTYVLVQGSTARSIEHHENRLGAIETKVDKLADIQAGLSTLLERTVNMNATLGAVREGQLEHGTRLLTLENRLDAQNRATERFWNTTWPTMERRLDRLENLTIPHKHGVVAP